MRNIILVSGGIGAGKDTLGDYLVSNHGYKRFAFADKIKEILCTTFDITLEEMEELKRKEDKNVTNFGNNKDINMRTILQRFGTEAMQTTFGKSVWSLLVVNEINSDENKDCDIVITDYRFIDEYAQIVKLCAPNSNITRIYVGYKNGLNLHSSETELKNIAHDFQIANDSTIEAYYDEIDKVLGVINNV